MDYSTLKIIHVLSASILYGGGLCLLLYHIIITKNSNKNRQIRVGNVLFKLQLSLIIPCGGIQLVTGFMMINIKEYSLHQFWTLGSVIGFVLAMIAYLASVFQQHLALSSLNSSQKSQIPMTFKRHTMRQWCLAIITFVMLSIIIFFMSAGPNGWSP